MNMNLTGIIILATGCILIYGAVKNKNPIDVVKESLSGKPPATPPAAPVSQADRPPGFIGPVDPYPSN